MRTTTEYFVNDWNKQVVLENIDDVKFIVVEREVHHFEGSIEVSEVVEYFKTKNEALDFIHQTYGFASSEPDHFIDPEWMDNIPF